MSSKSAIAQKFAAMPPKKRMVVAGGGIFLILAVVGIFMSPSNPAPLQKSKEAPQNSLAMPGGSHDLSFEKLAAQVEASTQDLERVKQKNSQLEKALAAKPAVQPQGSSETLAELKKVKDDMETLKKRPSLDDELPPPSANDMAVVPVAVEPKPEPSKLRIIGGAPRAEKNVDAPEQQQPIVFLPAGSNFEGVLLNGMDAPTSAVTMKNPVPALLRIKTDAILPNRHRYDVRECFVIVSGFGVLSTERAQLQLVSLSCEKNDGSVIETKLEGYLVGEDGKVGLRGRLVTKQGQIIAKSLVAGFFSGFSAAMAPTAVPQLNTTPGATVEYQLPNLANAATAGAAQGMSASAAAISKFYLDMAKEMFPVIEVDSMRRATIILTKGVELNINNGKDK